MKPLASALNAAHELKVVVAHSSDFDWAQQNANVTKPGCKLFIQPEFEKFNKLIPLIVEYVKNHPEWQISLQTHKYIGIP
jgi:organic radical activating enzyme